MSGYPFFFLAKFFDYVFLSSITALLIGIFVRLGKRQATKR